MKAYDEYSPPTLNIIYMGRGFFIMLRKRIIILWIKECFFNASVGVVLITAVLLIWRLFNPPAPFSADISNLAAMRAPPTAISNLYQLSHDIPFDRVLAMYAIVNDFFPQGETFEVEPDALKRDYVVGFNRLRRQYSQGDIRPYFEMFNSLINELRFFPIPREYEYMFSDTWGEIMGTAILDQKNIPGRIPVLSMTEGRIHQAKWRPGLGYHVLIITSSGTRVLYAHLDVLDEETTLDGQVEAGQKLGAMGKSGNLTNVHLHIGISPQVPFANDFWINPYPFLRHMEGL